MFKARVAGVAMAVLCGACGDNAAPPGDGRVEVVNVGWFDRSALDLLVVMDDSPGGCEMQMGLDQSIWGFLEALVNGGGSADLHLGVVTSDLGTQGALDSEPGPPLGSVGMAGCAGTGRAGELQNAGSIVSGAFISDTRNEDGSRSTNYSGRLEDAFASLDAVGCGGCGFEQPLEAMRRALDQNPANAGFLRDDAYLAVLVVTDEDDCSFTHSTLLDPDTSVLGPRQSFRCTRFGVQCDDGGTTPDEMNIPGDKAMCHSNETSPYLTSIERYRSFLADLKGGLDRVALATISGPPSPVTVELRTPPSGGYAIPALVHSCSYQLAPTDTEVADPAVRIAELVDGMPNHTRASVCTTDDSPGLSELLTTIKTMMPSRCIKQKIALPADCLAFDVLDGVSTAIPACADPADPMQAKPCFRIVQDSQFSCYWAPQQLVVVIDRTDPPPRDTFVRVTCKPAP